MLVNNEGLATLSLLKIQSDPLGNLRDLSFDGDEMNLHMPQDPESEAELRNLAAVPYQIISPANNKSIIGIYQDSMLGCYQFTREKEYKRGSINVKEGIRFEPRDAMNLLMMFQRVNENALFEKGNSVSNFDSITSSLSIDSSRIQQSDSRNTCHSLASSVLYHKSPGTRP